MLGSVSEHQSAAAAHSSHKQANAPEAQRSGVSVSEHQSAAAAHSSHKQHANSNDDGAPEPGHGRARGGEARMA